MSDDHEPASALETSRLTDKIVSFVIDTPQDRIPHAAFDNAKILLLDTVGVALAAAKRPIGQIVSRHVQSRSAGQPSATVLGGGFKTSAEMAALANGAMANALDFDSGGHSPTIIAPAALALAEERGFSGKDALCAFILAFEAIQKLTKVIEAKRRSSGRGGASPTKRGWWHVGLTGPIGAALAASRLLGLTRAEAAMAVGVATCSSGGFRRNMGTMAKCLHSGNAARAGIEAALLVQGGFTGASDILEAPLGFVGAISPPDERDSSALDELGQTYELARPQGLKIFPAVTPAHAIIDAGLALRREHRLTGADIVSARAHFTPVSLMHMKADDEEEAGFCGPFLLALALERGAVDLEQYDHAGLNDQNIKALMGRIANVPASEQPTGSVTVKLRDGRELTAQGKTPRYITREDALRKFDLCARPALGAQTERAAEQLLTLDRLADVRAMMAACGGAA